MTSASRQAQVRRMLMAVCPLLLDGARCHDIDDDSGLQIDEVIVGNVEAEPAGSATGKSEADFF